MMININVSCPPLKAFQPIVALPTSFVGTAIPFPAPEPSSMNPFLSACGATGQLQLSVDRQGRPEVEHLSFDTPFVLIGRNPISDIALLHAKVSERHAFLQLIGGRLFFADLGSRQGVYLAGRRQRTGWIDRQQAISIGPYRIRLIAGDVDSIKPQADSPPGEVSDSFSETTDRPSLNLELLHRSLRSSRFQVQSEFVLIGSATECQVRLLDPSVSNYHCCLLHTSMGSWIVDLLGGQGVLLSGTTVRYGKLRDRDVLHLGQSQIRCDLESTGETILTGPATRHEPLAIEQPVPTPLAPSPALNEWASSECERLGRLTLASVEVPELGQRLARLTPDQAALIETIVVPLVDQFNRMQQQLAVQFHQAGMMLFDTFSTLNEEHVERLREAPEKVHRISQDHDATRLTPQDEQGTGSGSGPTKSTPASGLALTRHRNSQATSTSAVKAALELSAENMVTDPSPPLSERLKPPDEVMMRPIRPGRTIDADIHALLYRRISTLDREEQGYWKKLLGIFSTHVKQKTVP